MVGPRISATRMRWHGFSRSITNARLTQTRRGRDERVRPSLLNRRITKARSACDGHNCKDMIRVAYCTPRGTLMAKLDVSKATLDQKKEILKLAAETRRFEIERFWGRSIFFWGFIAAAFVAYGQLYSQQRDGLPFVVSCFGLVCSVAWTLANRGGKYWQEAWEGKVEAVERDV